MTLFDTHCHLDVAAFDPDRTQVLASARGLGVSDMLIPGITAKTWQRLLALCQGEADLHPALGLHPVFINDHQDCQLMALEYLLAVEQPVAIGEIGLDYYLADLDPARQHRFLEAQLDIAHNAALPVILHVRKAHEPVLTLLKKAKVEHGIVHAFNGSRQQADRYIDLGFKLGFGGMLTYQRSRKLRALAKSLPLDAIVLETDAPDMTGERHHGERNSPEYMPDHLQALAAIRNEDPAMIAARTTTNAKQALKID